MWFESILNVVNKIELPDGKDKHGNYIKQNSVHISEKTGDVHLFTDPDKNALCFDNQKLTGVFKTKKFRYKVAPLIVATGHAEVDLKKIEV